MSKSLQPVDQMVPGANLGAYVQAVSSIPVLSIEQERELAEDLFYNDNLDAARQLVMSHLRFVAHIARSYKGYGLSEADLIQEGNVGLMKAVKRFNPEVGVRLVSFAVHWIKAEMHEFILRNWRIVKVATTKAQRKLFFNLRSSKKRLAWLTPEETKVMAQELGVSEQEVARMEGRMTASDMAFDGYGIDDDLTPGTAPVHFLELEGTNPEDLVAEEDWHDNAAQKLSAALGALDARSRDIVQSRWLTDDKTTLHELGGKYDVSAERIRQIEKNAIKKLKAAFVDEAA